MKNYENEIEVYISIAEFIPLHACEFTTRCALWYFCFGHQQLHLLVGELNQN
jgi:hypothetical protein